MKLTEERLIEIQNRPDILPLTTDELQQILENQEKTEQYKKALDEIKEYVNSYDTPEYGYPWHNKLKAILGEK